MRWDCLCLSIVMKKKKAAILWDSGQLSGSHFGAAAHSRYSGRSRRIEQKSSDIPKILPSFLQLAALEVASVYSSAFSWSHFPELVHNPPSQSKYLTTTASSDKEVRGLTSFCVSFCFFLNFAPSSIIRSYDGEMLNSFLLFTSPCLNLRLWYPLSVS